MQRLYNAGTIGSAEPAVLHLYERAGLVELADALDELEINFNRDELLWAGRVLGWRNFRPGRYEISGELSYDSFLSNMARGIQDPASVTVLPGTDIGRLSAHLARQVRPDSVEFAEIFTDSSEIAIELGLTGEELFSRMLPDTYQVFWTSSAENTVRRIYNEFQRAVAQRYRSQIEESQFTLSEVITLASIVEWEARHAEEKPVISGLYINRLNRNMRLQADPTVLYALGERRRLLFEDYRFEHPYNTYLISGLPPGPITNPDRRSIEAVLQPADHSYLYMVATPDGSHIFNRTFEEHRRSSAEWRNWIQEQYRIKRQREREAQESGSSL